MKKLKEIIDKFLLNNELKNIGNTEIYGMETDIFTEYTNLICLALTHTMSLFKTFIYDEELETYFCFDEPRCHEVNMIYRHI